MRLPATKAYFDTYARAAVPVRDGVPRSKAGTRGKYIHTFAAARCAAVVVYGGVDRGGLDGLKIFQIVRNCLKINLLFSRIFRNLYTER